MNRFEMQSTSKKPLPTNWRYPERQPIEKPIKEEKSLRREYTKIDPDAKLLGVEQIEGVHLLTDPNEILKLHFRIRKFIKCPLNYLPLMWSVDLSLKNIEKLESNPYVVSVKPFGHHLLLYIHPDGSIYLINNAQHIFRVDDQHTLKINFNGRKLDDTILDGIMNSSNSGGKFTFYIQDAISHNGVNLINLGILKRIKFVKEEMMKPRKEELEKDNLFGKNEAFNLDMVEIGEPYLCCKEFLAKDFEKNFRYSVKSLVFFPQEQGYKYGTNYDLLDWSYLNEPVEGSFRLKVPVMESQESINQGKLYVLGKDVEFHYADIALTDELRQLDEEIIACQYIDQQWIFKNVRKARQHPNSRNTIEGKFEAFKNPVSHEMLLMYIENFQRKNID